LTAFDDLVDVGLLQSNVSLGSYTTYKSGGPALWFAEVQTKAELSLLIECAVGSDLDVLVIGRGSNLVVADEGFPGLVVRLSGEFAEFAIDGNRVVAGAAAPLPRLARASVEAEITGLEFFVGIPGSVGGAVRQNAGCFGTETKDRLVSAEIVDVGTGVERSASPKELAFSYRNSNVATSELVTAATFEGRAGSTEQGKAELLRITRWRKEHQPGGTLNAGSVFKNPSNISAGELIDSLSLKGLSVGDVSISHKHANFFVAGSEATSIDIFRLVELVKSRVFELTGTMLEPEIEFVGFEK
jgi:UDP-N-acetylmuramate dehydrogenase